MKQNYLYACLLSLTLFSLASQAQDSSRRFRTAGFLIGYGREINIDTRYNPVFFKGDFSWQFDKKARRRFFSFYLQPQVNLVATVRPTDFEFGTNIGIRYYQQLSPTFFLYQMLGAGPHFITADLPRQAKGFIFSDNLGIGFLKEVNREKALYLNVQFLVRHISNAGFKEPNAGVNSLNLLLGLSRRR
jgi:hypothetical protein